jgi:hypothetical protein
MFHITSTFPFFVQIDEDHLLRRLLTLISLIKLHIISKGIPLATEDMVFGGSVELRRGVAQPELVANIESNRRWLQLYGAFDILSIAAV